MPQKFIHLGNMKILGISAYYHDSAAVLIEEGKIVAAAQEERFTRIKHDASFPTHAIEFCLQAGNTRLQDLEAVVFYDKPFLKFERILQTVTETAPKGLGLFLQSMPVWLKEKLFLKSEIKKRLKKMAGKKWEVPLLFSSHHLSHAASAFYASPFEEAAILTIDGVGEWATASIGHGKGSDVQLLNEIHFPHSLGLLYASFTAFLGFKVNEGEYKVMGLAPYADPTSARAAQFYERIQQHLLTVHDDGSLCLNLPYFSYTHAHRMIPVKKWETLFGIPQRLPDAPLLKEHAELAWALQRVTEDVVLKMARHARDLTGSRYLCMAGGVALNCVANGKLRESGLFDDIYIQPAAGDAGGALGAALAVYHQHLKRPRIVQPDLMQGGALGMAFSDAEIEQALAAAGLTAQKHSTEEMLQTTARFLAQGLVVGWFNGRMEFGPRALGHRSILGNASLPHMQRTLNLKIKKRESFRPFAPIMAEEELGTYFSKAKPNGYMLFVHTLDTAWRIPRPTGFYEQPLGDMLQAPGSLFPAITHIDYTARIQTVPKNSSAAIRQLLDAFKRLTGQAVLVNTSFNVKDEPIVCTPADAIRCFLQTEMDILVLENYVIEHKRNP